MIPFASFCYRPTQENQTEFQVKIWNSETNFLTKLSHDMTISEFYRTHKLRFNVPRTYLYLIIRNKIGLPATIG